MSRIQPRMEDLGGTGEAVELAGAAFSRGRSRSEAFSSIAGMGECRGELEGRSSDCRSTPGDKTLYNGREGK